METIDGQVTFTIAGTQKLLNGGRSSVYRLIADKKLEVIKVDGLGPRVTARSIRRLLGLDGAPEAAPDSGNTPEPPAGGASGPRAEQTAPRRRGRPRRVGRPQSSAA